MTLFRNTLFQVAVRRVLPSGWASSLVHVQMAGPTGPLVPVSGKFDTGAFRTMLTFATAARLGIADPTSSYVDSGTAYSVTGHPLTYYMHPVLVQIASSSAQAIVFPLRAAFSDAISRDLFGVDWLAHVCVAADRQAIHFLRD